MVRFFPLFMLLALAACKSIEVGTGDIRLSADASRSLDQYLTLSQNPIGFAVTADGSHHSAIVCPSASLCAGSWRADLQHFCERRSDGRPCYILAERKKIIWKGNIKKFSGLDLTATDAIVTYIRPQRVETRGPNEATGVILYLPGTAGTGQETARDDGAIPPYLRALNHMGWDILRGNVADSLRVTTSRANYAVTNDLIEKLANFRRQGYAKIVIAGQSAGAAEALELVKRKTAKVDAVIASVPGCCGTLRNPDGTYNDRFEQNWSYYNELISGMRNDRRVAVAFFTGDDFEPRDRKKISEQRFAAQQVPNFIIHQPSGIIGHSGAWHTAFSHLYAQCLNDFLVTTDAVASYDCTTPRRDPDDHRWMAMEFHLRQSDARLIPGAEIETRILGLTATVTNLYGGRAEFSFDPKEATVEISNSRGKKKVDYEIKRKLLCIENLGCNYLYEWDEDTLIGVSNGEIRFRAKVRRPKSS